MKLAVWFVSIAATAALTACDGGDPGEDAASAYGGGSITPPGCDHLVATRPGAEAPVVADTELGPDPTVQQVHLGVPADPRTTIAVTWRTLDDQTRAGTVKYGTGGALTDQAPGLTFAYLAGIGGSGDQVRIHEAHLCGLTPDTVYDYQVVSDAGHVSPVYSFRTAPDVGAAPDAEVVVAAVGDSRGGYTVWSQLVGELVTRTPDLVVFSGDAVTVGPLQDEWDEFFTAGEPLFAQVPVVAAVGNHELNAINFFAQFAQPGDEANYSFDYGHAHIVVLNDSPEESGQVTGPIADYLRDDLAANAAATWKIVNHHRGMYSASTRHGSDLTLRSTWGPFLDQYHVDLVLNGHDHDYERSFPMKAGTVQASPADGTVFVVSGGAGAGLYDNGTDFWTATSLKTHSATTIRLRRDLLDFEAFDQTGAVIDAFTITKP